MTTINANYAIFDGVNLNTVPGLNVLSINPYAPPKRRLSLSPVSRANKNRITSAFFNQRSIAVRVGIGQPTRDLLEVAIDRLTALLQGNEKELWLPQSGAVRKYTCTWKDTIEIASGGSYYEAELTFECSDVFGYDTVDRLLLQVSNFTSANKTDPIAVVGSADWQLPVITLTLSAVSGATAASYIKISNDRTGQMLTITRLFSAGDVIEINAVDNSVKVNGVIVATTGAIPKFAPGTGYLTYADNFTSRTFSNKVVYRPRWV